MKKTSKKSSKIYSASLKKTQDPTSVYIALLALVVIVVVFFLAYLSKMSKMPKVAVNSSSQQVVSSQMSGTQETTEEKIMTMEQTSSIPAGSRVKFKIDKFKKLALQPLEFEVFDEGGKAYTPADLQTVHEMNMHFILMSATLHDYQHLHPDFENGKWKVLANIPNPGTYYAYVDITPVKGDPVVLRSTLISQQPTTGASTYPGLTPNLFAITKGFKAQLTLSQNVALQQTVLSYAVTLNGKQVALENYLGALGHVVIVRENGPDSFMHVHPSDGKSEFLTTFVKGGRYTAFAEFKIGGKVYTFPITFDIQG